MGVGVRALCGVGAWALLVGSATIAQAQTELPQVVVKQPAQPKKRPPEPRRTARSRPAADVVATRPNAGRRSAAAAGLRGTQIGEADGGAATGENGPNNPAAVAERRADAARDRIFTRTGANETSLGRETIEALPQGDNQQFDKLILQLPGVSQDTAASGNLHIRNEHANVQTRINGIQLPDGVSGFGQFLETAFVGNVTLIDGALPAQYGLRTAGILDVTTRKGAFDNGGSFTLYGGGRSTITPLFTYGGHNGTTDWFVAGRFLQNQLGIENPTRSLNALHDRTDQGKGFGYVSTQIDDATRLTFITGSSVDRYQIPNTPGLTPSFTAFGQSDFNSARLNERQTEQSFYNVLALQRSVDDVDLQLSYFSRYSTLNFKPDVVGDLLFNGVASNVYRSTLTNGLQGDAAYRFNDWNTLRVGFTASSEQTVNRNNSVVLPIGDDGNPFDSPFGLSDRRRKTGFLVGVYAQDEIRLTDKLTLNAGLRFDQMYQYVDANQVSPRVGVTYRPFEGTTFHAGYARYFTPPQQALSAPPNIDQTAGTTLQPAIGFNSPVKPERSNVYDIGVSQVVLPGLELGVDAYYKQARDLLDDGQFGQALVLDTFNYQQAYNEGVEFKAKYINGGFMAYGNVAIGRQQGKNIISNQSLFDPDEFAYIQNKYVYTDHSQTITASGGISYKYRNTRVSADMIYGSGLRSGFANTGHVPDYFQVNLGLTHEVLFPGFKPTVLRFDVVNLLDKVYEIRDGSGIGVFAPQYGPRRAFLGGITQQF